LANWKYRAANDEEAGIATGCRVASVFAGAEVPTEAIAVEEATAAEAVAVENATAAEAVVALVNVAVGTSAATGGQKYIEKSWLGIILCS
jgi:hypothetical protein